MEAEDQFLRCGEEPLILIVPLCSHFIHKVQSNYVCLLCLFRFTEENAVILYILLMKCVVSSGWHVLFVFK
jgi:hypothetical protein